MIGDGAADYRVPRYCNQCGTAVSASERHGEPASSCGCGHVQVLRPTVGVAVVIVEDEQLLLVRRAYGERAGKWCIPCGHVGWGEDVRDAAARELLEKPTRSPRSVMC